MPKEPERDELVITKVLYALSDDVRLSIARKLDEDGPCTCGVFEVDRPKSSLSHHFRVLRESGIVSTTRHGTALLNTLRRKDLDARFPRLLDAILEQPSARVARRKS